MVCEMRKRGGSPGGEISADGEPFYKDGMFLPVTGFEVD
jgi:hypothetical protein